MKPSEIKTLLHILMEERSANGGNFASPDSEFWFRQEFADFDESNSQALERLFNQHKGIDPQKHNKTRSRSAQHKQRMK